MYRLPDSSVLPGSVELSVYQPVAAPATGGRVLPAMLPMHGYQGFRTAPVPSGWVQLGDSWVTAGCCGGAVGRSPKFPQPRAVGCVYTSVPGRCGRPRTNGRPASPRASGMRSAGARSGSTRRCNFKRRWPGCWTPSRPSRSNRCPLFLRPVSSSNRPGAWPRQRPPPQRGSGKRWSRPSRRQ